MNATKQFALLLLATIFAASSARSALITYTATPTLGASNTTFNFNLFDSNLGMLTAVDLLLTSSTAGGSVSIDTNSSGEQAELTNLTARIRTSGTGLTQQNTTSVALSVTPGLPSTVPAFSSQSFTVTGSQSLISSTLTYGINPANWGSYQIAGGAGNTPNFTGLALNGFSITSDILPTTSNSLFTAATSYTLRYTYTPAGPSPVPEPGQVAASLLLLGGIGTYLLIKRRQAARQAV